MASLSKTNSSMTVVTICPDEAELVEPRLKDMLNDYFTAGQSLSVDWARLRRRCPFRLHALRNRKAMQLVQAHQPRTLIKERLLWRDGRSLDRYLRLNQGQIESRATVDAAISVLRSYL